MHEPHYARGLAYHHATRVNAAFDEHGKIVIDAIEGMRLAFERAKAAMIGPEMLAEMESVLRKAWPAIQVPAPRMRLINKSGYPLAHATSGSVGLDLRAVFESEHRDVPARGRFHYGTGIYVEIPEGYGGFVKPRSGLARAHGVWAIDGTIDHDYRGEIRVLLYNSGPEPYRVLPGDKIAQLVITPSPRMTLEEVEELTDTERGASGFGSTGR